MFEYTLTTVPSITTKKQDVPIPKPGPDEVLIKVIATAGNPKDWKLAEMKQGVNQGDDLAGIVQSVGENVWEYKEGDRVAAFHRMGFPHGSYAEHAIAQSNLTFRLPNNVSFEAGSTLPLAAATAGLALYQHLELPAPWSTNSETKDTPLLIYGGASTVGAFALQFAQLSGFNPIITVAGNGIDFVSSLNSATHIVDYRKNHGKDVVSDILNALNGKTLRHAFDAVGSRGSYQNISAILTDERNGKAGGHVNLLDPTDASWTFPASVRSSRTFVGSAYGLTHEYRTQEEVDKDLDFVYVLYRFLSKALADGRFKPHPFEVMPNGLESLQEGTQLLYDNKVSAKKLVYRIEETPSAGQA